MLRVACGLETLPTAVSMLRQSNHLPAKCCLLQGLPLLFKLWPFGCIPA